MRGLQDKPEGRAHSSSAAGENPYRPSILMFYTYAPMKPERVRSLDIARGLVMVLMAIDHVRVYAAIPAGGPTAAALFHALGDTFLRARLRVFRGRGGIPARPGSCGSRPAFLRFVRSLSSC